MTDSNKHLRPYSIRLGIFSVIVIGLFALAGLFVPEKYLSSAWPAIAVFFVFVTFVVHYLLTGMNITMNRFINTYMMVTVVKLLSFLSVLLVYALVRKEDALAFTLAFFVFYLFFTVFEIIFLLKHHRRSEE